MWLVVECHLPHNLTALSLNADVFLQSTEDGAPLITFFSECFGTLASDVLPQRLSGGLYTSGNYPTKQISGLRERVLWMLLKLILLTTCMPTGYNRAGTVWPFQF